MTNEKDQAICKAIIQAMWQGRRMEPGDMIEIETGGTKQAVAVEKRHLQTVDRASIILGPGFNLDEVVFSVPRPGETRTYHGQDLLP